MTTVVVRPSGSCQSTCHYLQQNGVEVVPLPLLKIVPQFRESGVMKTFCVDTDVLVATSANIAESLGRHQSRLPRHKPVIAVGQKTAAALAPFFERIVIPDTHNSEGVLKVLMVHQEWRTVTILKGAGGRKEIQTQLVLAGRTVKPLSLYSRVKNNEIEPIEERWQYVSNIIATSIELVQQVFARYPSQDFTQIRWIVLSERIASTLKSKGVANVIVTKGTSDKAILNALNYTNK